MVAQVMWDYHIALYEMGKHLYTVDLLYITGAFYLFFSVLAFIPDKGAA